MHSHMCSKRKGQLKRVVHVWMLEEMYVCWVILYCQETQVQSQHEASGELERRWRKRTQKHPSAAWFLLHTTKKNQGCFFVSDTLHFLLTTNWNLWLDVTWKSARPLTNTEVMLLNSPVLKYYVLAAGLGTLSSPADGNSNILMQMSKPNNPVFSKGSSAQNPRLMFPAVTLMWKKWPTVSEIIMPTSSLRLHTGTRSLQTGVLHILFLPLNPCIKPACVLTLEELVWAPICLSPPPPPPFPSAAWATYIWKLLSDIRGGQVLIPACEVCVNLSVSDSI